MSTKAEGFKRILKGALASKRKWEREQKKLNEVFKGIALVDFDNFIYNNPSPETEDLKKYIDARREEIADMLNNIRHG